MAKRKGRNRKVEARRHPCGKIVQRAGVDRGTPELQQRRHYMAQGGDTVKASFPLGLLWANNTITDSQYRAACRLAWLYGVCFGRVSLAAANYERGSRQDVAPEDGPAQERWRRRCQSELDRYLTALERLSWEIRSSVLEIAVFEHTPRWLLPVIPSFADVRAAQMFINGVKELERAAIGMNE